MFYFGDMAALILRLIGILIGAGFLWEYFFQEGLMKWLLRLLNWPDLKRFWKITAIVQKNVDNLLGKRTTFNWEIPNNVNQLWEKASQPLFILLPYLAVILDLIFSLGLWVWLCLNLYQLLAYNIFIPTYFWIVFAIWLLLLIIRNAGTALIQMIVITEVEEQSGEKLAHPSWLAQFGRNWYVYPWALLIGVISISLVVVLFLPLWIIRIFKKAFGRRISTSKKQRQIYYLAYSTLAILISIIIQIIVLYFRHNAGLL